MNAHAWRIHRFLQVNEGGVRTPQREQAGERLGPGQSPDSIWWPSTGCLGKSEGGLWVGRVLCLNMAFRRSLRIPAWSCLGRATGL